jgi:hypothetical protein
MQSAQFAIAFLVGFGGLKVVEYMHIKYITPSKKDEGTDSQSK